jgi:hypothetical protein
LKSSRSVIVVVMMGPLYVHACAVRRAKSANLIGGAPVTFWTLSLGREPTPEAMVSVNIRSISPYSAGTPASTLPWIDTSRSKLSRGPYRSDATVAAAARRHEEQRPRPRAEQVPLACAKRSPLIYTPWGSLVSL